MSLYEISYDGVGGGCVKDGGYSGVLLVVGMVGWKGGGDVEGWLGGKESPTFHHPYPTIPYQHPKPPSHDSNRLSTTSYWHLMLSPIPSYHSSFPRGENPLGNKEIWESREMS